MALRREEIDSAGALIYAFPTARVRSRTARHASVAGRRFGLALIGAGVITASVLGGGRAPASSPAGPRAVVLRQGQTLWEIAEARAPAGADPRAYVDAVIELNDLSGAPAAGQRLRLPR
jgi:Tfp pilus assembly protein FimV